MTDVEGAGVLDPASAAAPRALRRRRIGSTDRRYSVPATIAYVLLHAGCLGVVWTGITVDALAIFAGAFLLRAFGVSIVYHRYFAHRSYRASRAVQFLLGVYGALTVMGGLLWWASTHRRHHRTADTIDDIHSPRYQGFLYSHCGWFLARANRVVDLSLVPDLARCPELRWLERNDAAFKLAYIGCCGWWFGAVGVVWGFFVPTVVVLHMVHWIQSVSHSIGGYRRYPTRDNSRNHWLFGVLSLGEGFHHNHHCFPGSARIGLRWWELDAGYWVLALLARIGVIHDLNVAREGPDPPSPTEKDVKRVRAELRALSNRLDHALAGVDARAGPDEAARDGIAAFRTRVSTRVDSLALNARALLVRGDFALLDAAAELWRVSRAEARAAVAPAGAALVDVCVAEFDAAVLATLGRWQRAPAIASQPGASR